MTFINAPRVSVWEPGGTHTLSRGHVNDPSRPRDFDQTWLHARIEVSELDTRVLEDVISNGRRHLLAATTIEGRNVLGIPPIVGSATLAKSRVKRVAPTLPYDAIDRLVGVVDENGAVGQCT